MLDMFVRNARLAILAGCRPMSTTGGRLLPTSVLSLHRRFPYTLYKVNPGERSNIVDPTTSARSEYFYDRDEVENLRGGHVYPTITSSILDGPLFFPHTHWLQEKARITMDDYFNALDEGIEPIVPYIFRIPKETPVPDSLILVHHQLGWFSVQPVSALSLDEYNNTLDEFYFRHAEKILAEKWLEEHDYNSGDADCDPSTWH